MATHPTVTFTSDSVTAFCYKSRESQYSQKQKNKYLLHFCWRLCLCGAENKWNTEKLLQEKLFSILNPPLCSTSHTTDKWFFNSCLENYNLPIPFQSHPFSATVWFHSEKKSEETWQFLFYYSLALLLCIKPPTSEIHCSLTIKCSACVSSFSSSQEFHVLKRIHSKLYAELHNGATSTCLFPKHLFLACSILC